MLTRLPYDPWRDASGGQIQQHCRVEQVAVEKNHGALPSRLHKQGQVVGRGLTRLNVRFDDGTELVRIRPHLVRVVQTPGVSSRRESFLALPRRADAAETNFGG
ncbi:MAG: hypothetical protein M3Y48_07440 [Actinomycetota bacterium]|nr:hypothetical protein [Actinomycetota bacterium]